MLLQLGGMAGRVEVEARLGRGSALLELPPLSF